MCEAAVEAARLSGNPHYLFWALFELGFAALLRRRPRRRRSRPARRARGSAAAGGRHDARRRAAGPAGSSACALFEAGEARARRWDAMRALGSDELEHKIPVERCFDWEILALAELALGQRRGGRRLRRGAPRRNAAALGLPLPAALARAHARRGPARATGDAAGAAAQRRARRSPAAEAIGARLQRRLLAQPARARRSPRPGDRDGGDRRAARGRARARRLRLGARARRGAPRAAQARRAGRAARAGGRRETRASAALTTREREIAELVTDRHTNREIAARAVPQRQDGRVAPAQHLRQARRLLARRGRAGGRARRREATRERRPPRRPLDADAARLRRARLPPGAERGGCAILDNAARRLRGDLAGRRPVRGRARRHRWWRARRGSGCCRSRWPASACCSPSTPSWPSEFPIAGGAYQWTRRLIGRRLRLVQPAGWRCAPTRWPTRRSPTSARRGR